MRPETAQKILEKTKEDFNKIAEKFSESRKEPWEIMKVFAGYVKKGDKVLDIGCGNGRLYQLLQNRSVKYVGIDNSERLIETARKNFQFSISNFQLNSQLPITNDQLPIFQVADALELPFQDGEFDVAFMMAVLPHIPSEELQEKVLKEAIRVLKKDGYLFLTCWNLWQPKLFFENFFQRLKNPKLYQDLGWRDFFIPWYRQRGEIVQRFYHAFTKKELKKLLENIGFKILEIYYEYKGQKSHWLKGFNLVALARK